MQYKHENQTQIKIKNTLCMECRQPTCLLLNGGTCFPFSVSKTEKTVLPAEKEILQNDKLK